MSERVVVGNVIVPGQLVNFVKRLASLERGHGYSITLIVPERREDEPQWMVLPLGKVENQRRAEM